MDKVNRFRPGSVYEHFDPNRHFPADFFRPLPGGQRDKFGNRFVGSGILGLPEKGYEEKTHGDTRAGLLVSAEGENLLRTHRGLLEEYVKRICGRGRAYRSGD
jgi:hypothetical protein